MEYIEGDDLGLLMAKRKSALPVKTVLEKNPYARVNSENEFVTVNDPFLSLLGYGNKESLERESWGGSTSRTFLSILDEPSRERYLENLRKSRTVWRQRRTR
jgi:hypothetical protein